MSNHFDHVEPDRPRSFETGFQPLPRSSSPPPSRGGSPLPPVVGFVDEWSALPPLGQSHGPITQRNVAEGSIPVPPLPSVPSRGGSWPTLFAKRHQKAEEKRLHRAASDTAKQHMGLIRHALIQGSIQTLPPHTHSSAPHDHRYGWAMVAHAVVELQRDPRTVPLVLLRYCASCRHTGNDRSRAYDDREVIGHDVAFARDMFAGTLPMGVRDRHTMPHAVSRHHIETGQLPGVFNVIDTIVEHRAPIRGLHTTERGDVVTCDAHGRLLFWYESSDGHLRSRVLPTPCDGQLEHVLAMSERHMAGVIGSDGAWTVCVWQASTAQPDRVWELHYSYSHGHPITGITRGGHDTEVMVHGLKDGQYWIWRASLVNGQVRMDEPTIPKPPALGDGQPNQGTLKRYHVFPDGKTIALYERNTLLEIHCSHHRRHDVGIGVLADLVILSDHQFLVRTVTGGLFFFSEVRLPGAIPWAYSQIGFGVVKMVSFGARGFITLSRVTDRDGDYVVTRWEPLRPTDADPWTYVATLLMRVASPTLAVAVLPSGRSAVADGTRMVIVEHEDRADVLHACRVWAATEEPPHAVNACAWLGTFLTRHTGPLPASLIDRLVACCKGRAEALYALAQAAMLHAQDDLAHAALVDRIQTCGLYPSVQADARWLLARLRITDPLYLAMLRYLMRLGVLSDAEQCTYLDLLFEQAAWTELTDVLTTPHGAYHIAYLVVKRWLEHRTDTGCAVDAAVLCAKIPAVGHVFDDDVHTAPTTHDRAARFDAAKTYVNQNPDHDNVADAHLTLADLRQTITDGNHRLSVRQAMVDKACASEAFAEGIWAAGTPSQLTSVLRAMERNAPISDCNATTDDTWVDLFVALARKPDPLWSEDALQHVRHLKNRSHMASAMIVAATRAWHEMAAESGQPQLVAYLRAFVDGGPRYCATVLSAVRAVPDAEKFAHAFLEASVVGWDQSRHQLLRRVAFGEQASCAICYDVMRGDDPDPMRRLGVQFGPRCGMPKDSANAAGDDDSIPYICCLTCATSKHPTTHQRAALTFSAPGKCPFGCCGLTTDQLRWLKVDDGLARALSTARTRAALQHHGADLHVCPTSTCVGAMERALGIANFVHDCPVCLRVYQVSGVDVDLDVVEKLIVDMGPLYTAGGEGSMRACSYEDCGFSAAIKDRHCQNIGECPQCKRRRNYNHGHADERTIAGMRDHVYLPAGAVWPAQTYIPSHHNSVLGRLGFFDGYEAGLGKPKEVLAVMARATSFMEKLRARVAAHPYRVVELYRLEPDSTSLGVSAYV